MRRGCGSLGVGPRLRFHWHAWTNSSHAVDNNLLAGFEAFTNHALVLVQWTELHGTIIRGVGRADRQHIFLILIGADGAFRDKQRGVFGTDWQAHTREKPWQNASIWIRKQRAHHNAAGVRI